MPNVSIAAYVSPGRCPRLWATFGLTARPNHLLDVLHKRSVLRSLARIFAGKINREQKSLEVIIIGFVSYDIFHKPFRQDDIFHIYGIFEEWGNVLVLKAGDAAAYARD